MTHQAGVSVSAQSAPSGYTALHLACLSGHVGVVGLLLSRSTGGQRSLNTKCTQAVGGPRIWGYSHRAITLRGAKPCRLVQNWNLLLTLFGSRHCTYAYIPVVVLRRRGGNISVDMSVVLLYNTNFMNKLKFNDLKIFKITPLSTQRNGWST